MSKKKNPGPIDALRIDLNDLAGFAYELHAQLCSTKCRFTAETRQKGVYLTKARKIHTADCRSRAKKAETFLNRYSYDHDRR